MTSAELGYLGLHHPGSRKEIVHRVFDEEGDEAARQRAADLGIKPSTYNSWASAFRRLQRGEPMYRWHAGTAKAPGTANVQESLEATPSQARLSRRLVEASLTTAIPIPIRRDIVVKVLGLPFDLSKAEASKISNVIMAMAQVE